MGKGRGNSDNGCSKTLLVIINGIFMVLGLGVLALGIYLKVDPSYSAFSKVLTETPNAFAQKNNANLLNLEAASIAIIVIGAVVAGISIIGILGACFELKALIIIYGVVITLLLLALLAIGVAALVFKFALRKNFEDEVKSTLKDQLFNEYEGEVQMKSAFTIAVDVFQIYFKCCGVYNYTDFTGAKKWNSTIASGSLKAPISCCKYTDEQRDAVLKGLVPKLTDYSCAQNPSSSNSNFETGCLSEMNIYLDRILLAILIITIVVGFILIIGSVSSCCMCRSM